MFDKKLNNQGATDAKHKELDSLEAELDPEVLGRLKNISASMPEGEDKRSSPVREIFKLLGDKWSTLILMVLSTGTFRYATLRRTVIILANQSVISERVLTEKLRVLERDGLVARKASADVPPRVDYSLTLLGSELFARVGDLIVWLVNNRERVEEARSKYDKQ